jgi:crotonobetainyl-CoA:carnitine CoA-transferase CaiB-like acyl-CoA transferase
MWGRLDRPLETADGFLAVAAEGEDTRARLATACGLGKGAGDERVANRLRDRPAVEWEARLAEAGVPAAAVCRTVCDLPSDPNLEPLLERLDGGCVAPAAPWRFRC